MDDRTRAHGASQVVPPLAVLIRLKDPGGQQKVVRLAGGRVVVGAAPDADLVINDDAVSREHLELSLAPEGVCVRDLQSTNGTFFDGHRIGELSLALGATIKLGSSSLRFEADVDDFEGTQGAEQSSYGPLVGQSAAMQRLFTLLGRLEGSLAGVLIEGESGSGKELVAQAIHERSQVQSGPFLALNCGALDRSLVRSELFGHKKGAFTGALADSVGAFEAAGGGTLFLDEIGELPREIQPLLLRVLETGDFTRIGETRSRKAKVRLVAATNRNLKEDVADGLFREDLYYRLKIVTLTAPPLRARPEDIGLLATHLSEQLGAAPLPETVLQELQRRSFPGNVRELKHAIAAYQAIGELPEVDGTRGLDDDSLLSFIDASKPYAEQKDALIDRMTFLYLRKLIEDTQGNRSEAARVAGLQRGYLRRLLEKYALA